MSAAPIEYTDSYFQKSLFMATWSLQGLIEEKGKLHALLNTFYYDDARRDRSCKAIDYEFSKAWPDHHHPGHSHRLFDEDPALDIRIKAALIQLEAGAPLIWQVTIKGHSASIVFQKINAQLFMSYADSDPDDDVSFGLYQCDGALTDVTLKNLITKEAKSRTPAEFDSLLFDESGLNFKAVLEESNSRQKETICGFKSICAEYYSTEMLFQIRQYFEGKALSADLLRDFLHSPSHSTISKYKAARLTIRWNTAVELLTELKHPTKADLPFYLVVPLMLKVRTKIMRSEAGSYLLDVYQKTEAHLMSTLSQIKKNHSEEHLKIQTILFFSTRFYHNQDNLHPAAAESLCFEIETLAICPELYAKLNLAYQTAKEELHKWGHLVHKPEFPESINEEEHAEYLNSAELVADIGAAAAPPVTFLAIKERRAASCPEKGVVSSGPA